MPSAFAASGSESKPTAAKHYTDEALQVTAADQLDHFVEVFQDKIPKTHGAPVRRVLEQVSLSPPMETSEAAHVHPLSS